MNIVEGFPPCYEDIKRFFPISIYSVYAYGNTLYKHPLNEHEIPPDTEWHESIHSKQQREDPQTWWMRYCVDKKFRLQQELEAYGGQYAIICAHWPTRTHKDFLFALASDLASEQYGVGLSYQQAEQLIRLQAKRYGTLIETGGIKS